jgi:nucleolar protein 14
VAAQCQQEDLNVLFVMGKIKNKTKKKRLSEKVVKTDSQKQKVLNPFEVHVNRQKYEVLGRKTKNDTGLPGVARAKAIAKVRCQ